MSDRYSRRDGRGIGRVGRVKFGVWKVRHPIRRRSTVSWVELGVLVQAASSASKRRSALTLFCHTERFRCFSMLSAAL